MLINLRCVARGSESNSQSHNNKNEEQIPMIQCNKKQLFYVETLIIFIRLRIVCLFLVCHGFLNIKMLLSKNIIKRYAQRDNGKDRGIREGGEAPLLDLQRFHINDVVRLQIVIW